ncbi:hypothetical protein IKW75_00670 [Candidatus Saccharibacteria bacterium]|nr:hypothetical protein [Candidatus Saccharibacteria bacterium]
MKNNINKERVEVMALFGYEMTPCQPLSFKRYGESGETEVTELIRTRVSFAGNVATHFFEVMAGRKRFELSFNSNDLSWHLAAA